MLDILAVMHDVDDIVRLAQGLAQPIGQFAIVFDKQQPHFLSLFRNAARRVSSAFDERGQAASDWMPVHNG
ncbi:hypothetical protein GCM10007880_34380 [Mesorhizobium amorphae]|nr:hypothetical protein GCM10007880_34380 [Mesorhizobium amorphae]